MKWFGDNLCLLPCLWIICCHEFTGQYSWVSPSSISVVSIILSKCGPVLQGNDICRISLWSHVSWTSHPVLRYFLFLRRRYGFKGSQEKKLWKHTTWHKFADSQQFAGWIELLKAGMTYSLTNGMWFGLLDFHILSEHLLIINFQQYKIRKYFRR